MQLRIFTEPQQGASYDELLAIAQAAERAGFDAFFRSDHYLKMEQEHALPAYTDAWLTLAGLARDTKRIRLGTLVSPVTFRQLGTFPLLVSQVDHMSGGRIEVGVGAGWFEQEHANYGIAFPALRDRYDALEDQLEILHGLWSTTGSTFAYSGRTTNVELDVAPLAPLQRPHPPIIVGGSGRERNADLAARFADEFNRAFASRDDSVESAEAVRRACTAIGRDPATMTFSIAQTCVCGSDEAELARRAAYIGRSVEDLRKNALAGTPAEVREQLSRWEAAGFTRCYLQLLDLRDLEHVALLGETLLSAR
ncbi:MAG: TIGR03560 family F420-dependent LLM class oxidoreductase [Actinomycetota bacterium]|nr:TIGR03560 family F420-dependent LLM class oxidoreductase [Actinomycetota bacterium]